MTEFCLFCNGPLNPFDEGIYKEVKGWVHGKKADSMTLREYTDKYAHERCILKLKSGQPADQPDLLGEEKVVASSDMFPDSAIEYLLANPEPVEPTKEVPSFEEFIHGVDIKSHSDDRILSADPEENGYF